ncbi:BMC domain-containing protein [Vagococcus sp. PNs007]|uniref:BMC domain-containing protein n=1 Tax=Vagococcus proximus TaxID=2991417 RepID=A0ABT5WZE9_9ENTE|nr:BMC domain-containing protein [Vagococcus proximus]MDF0479135.1 BMC domain-containing protein [Vagococcus proximus]
MSIQALGLIEVNGFLGAVAAADAALKTADVQLISAEKISGGITTIQLSGNVSAVQVAVETGSRVANDLTCLRSSHVIPRLADEAAEMVLSSLNKEPKAEMKSVITEEQVELLPVGEAKPEIPNNSTSAKKETVKKQSTKKASKTSSTKNKKKK